MSKTTRVILVIFAVLLGLPSFIMSLLMFSVSPQMLFGIGGGDDPSILGLIIRLVPFLWIYGLFLFIQFIKQKESASYSKILVTLVLWIIPFLFLFLTP